METENVEFAYGDNLVLRNVSCGINRGEITGLVGANGAGKTTLMKKIIKKRRPRSGRIIIDGKDIFSLKNENNPVALIPDVPVYYEELTVWEHLRFVKALYPQNVLTLDKVINTFHLQRHLHKIPGTLSKGNLQKLMIALALLRQYDVLLADEPFTGLDPEMLYRFRQILQELKQQGKAILISTHLLDMAESICDRYIFLNDGQILAEGSKEELIRRYAHGSCRLNAEASLEELYLLLADGGNEHVYL